MKKILTVLAMVTLAACSGKMDHTDHKMTEGIVISSARVLPPFPGKDTAAGYFKITNHGAADKLISVTSPISGAVEIHNHLEEDGVMKMRRVDGVDLAAGTAVEFRPGSYHLMMFKAALPDTQDEVSLTLNYENAPSVTIIVPVEGRGDDEEDHSGH